jgi:hypothetical protein
VHEAGLVNSPPKGNAMNKTETTEIDDNIKADAIESIENVELDSVTGGCSSCGCGQLGPISVQPQPAVRPTWLRR